MIAPVADPLAVIEDQAAPVAAEPIVATDDQVVQAVAEPVVPPRARDWLAEASLVTDVARYDETGSDFFEELYLALNPDIAAEVANGGLRDGAQHWVATGQFEAKVESNIRNTLSYVPPDRPIVAPSRDPSVAGDGFDVLSYLYLNRDVMRALNADPELSASHWVSHGRAEGRIAPGVRKDPLRRIDLGALYNRPLGINLFGPFGTSSGLGTAARGLAKAVRETGLPFELYPFDATSGELRPGVNKRNLPPTYRINLILANADQIARVFAAYPRGWFDNAFNIAVWAWELASPRADSYYAFDGIDEVWTNSQFEYDGINAISPIPVSKIHLPVVPPAEPVAPARNVFGIPEGAFTFIVPFDVGSTSARKNPFLAVQAFRALQAKHRNICLVLKYHSSQFEPNLLRQLLTAIAGDPKVIVLSSSLNLAQLDQLRASCNCLVSAHRSEGFGLNIAEYMALGKPVVATGYSGNMDWFDETVGYPIQYKLIELAGQTGPYQHGFQWADPILESLIEQMDAVLSDPATAQQRGARAAERIRTMLSLEAVSKSMLERFDALGLSEPLPPFAQVIGRGDHMTRQTLARSIGADRTLLRHNGAKPFLSIVVPVYNVPPRYLEACIQSVLNQDYPLWELCICDDCSSAPGTTDLLEAIRGSSPMIKIVRNQTNLGIAAATNRAIEMATGDFIVLLDNDDVMMPFALREVAKAIADDPLIDLIYSDEDKIDENGQRIDHFYKPDWSPEHLESVMYVLHMFVIRKSLLIKLGGLRPDFDGAQDYDLMLRCSRMTDRIHHIPKILYRWRAIPGSAAAVVDAKPTALQNGLLALQQHTRIKYGPDARAEPGLLQGTFRVRRGLTVPPPVSLLILTGNATKDLPDRGETVLIDNLVSSIREKTEYTNYTIFVIDNSTLRDEQKARFSAGGVQIRNFERPGPFNYSAKANFALKNAPTEIVVLMNDDMEVIRPDWLTAMVELISDPGIGAVGARLLHADGSIQHVGSVLGVNGGAAHPYHSYPRDFVGYNGFTHIIRNYSAVTAACLATRRSLAAQVGYLDEKLSTDYNDTDFCLKLRAIGYRIAYTPYAELYHFEGSSIPRTSQDAEEFAYFCQRWADVIAEDPFYNVNLTRSALDFSERAA